MELRKSLQIFTISTLPFTFSGCTSLSILYVVNDGYTSVQKLINYVGEKSQEQTKKDKKAAILKKSLTSNEVDFKLLFSKYNLLSEDDEISKFDKGALALNLGVFYKDINSGKYKTRKELHEGAIKKLGLNINTINWALKYVSKTDSFKFFAEIDEEKNPIMNLETLLAQSIKNENIILTANKDK